METDATRSAIRIRPARPDDAKSLGAMVASLSRRSLYRRFLYGVSLTTATAELQREVQDRKEHSKAFVAEDADGRIVGEAYAAALEDGSAEVSFVVTDQWQQHGVGTLLRDALFEQLRADGINVAYAEVHSGNRAMLDLLRDADLPLQMERRDAGLLWVRVELGL